MKAVLAYIAIAYLLASCTGNGSSTDIERSSEPDGNALGSQLKDLGIRFDGYYREEVGKVVYLIRFFPEGNVVLANATHDIEEQLPPLLVNDAAGDPRTGYYNVPVSIRGDSLFFTTRATRGELSYRGRVLDASRVRFLRHSHINGARHLKEYIFYPDPLAIQ